MRILIALPVVVLAASITATSSAPATKVLRGTVGPSFTITVKNAAGKVVKTTKAGTYRLIVKDKSTFHDFHLIGPGINRVITSVPFTGTKTVIVKLKAGRRYIYRCDPHRLEMKGSFKVTA
jgi:plastocyanin